MILCNYNLSGAPYRLCRARAACRLHAPDGNPVPGSYLCREHAQAIIDEYRDKLGEEWTLRAPTLCPHLDPDNPRTWVRWDASTGRASCDACMMDGFLLAPAEESKP